MAGVILSRSKYAEKPYYITNMSINIYSLEELCYYIYNNIYLIGTDLVDDGLISYIDNELEEPELAKQLQFLVSEEAGLSEIVMTILHYVDYYDNDEIEELKEIIDGLDKQNATERLKLRADNFLNSRRYDSAIRNYELIVYGRKDESLPVDFYGNVWHNMGIAYVRMFFFREAEVCFKTAYEINKNISSLKSSVVAKILGANGNMEFDDEMSYVTAKEVETIMDHIDEEVSYVPLLNAIKLREEGRMTEYNDAVNEVIDNWKNEYRNYMK